MTHRLLAAIWAALDALAAGDVRLATDILLAAVEEGAVNPAVPQRPPGGWPGERAGDVSDLAPERQIIPPPTDPIAVARVFAAGHYLGIGGTLLLRHHRNTFYR